MQSPFHEGEQQVQALLGVREEIEPWARRVVRAWMPEEHRAFHSSLPFLVAAARDDRGRPWATILTGSVGFVDSPDPEHLTIATRLLPGDPLERHLSAGADLGLLGIDLATRRRNRVNGRIIETAGDRLVFRVGQAFGNCPQYIRHRNWRQVATPSATPPAHRADTLSRRQQAWIQAADTLFIASGHGSAADSDTQGMDASHRGGEPGFVQVLDGRRLVFPDYAGNNHYNTIGNLVMDPRMGLLLVDFTRGSLLHLTGRASIDWGSAAVARVPGARRLVDVDIDEVVERPEVLPLRWDAQGEAVRSLRLIDKLRESEDVASFVLAARDGRSLPDFEPGQHLPIELDAPGPGAPPRIRRTYSLSNAPGSGYYRISVKRHPRGLASRLLHDGLEPGARVNAYPPAGDFVLRPGRRPVVLLSAGIGITPMMSMLHALADPGENRAVCFIHGVRDGRHHPFAAEVRQLAGRSDRIEIRFAYSRPRDDDVPGRDFDVEGRIDGALVAELLPDLDADYYLCGPTTFLTALGADLEARGVPAERIHTEDFGPAS